MFISDIIPLTNLPLNAPQILSYYSSEELKPGAIVEINLNKQKINGVIYKTVDIKQRKAIIKKSDFSLKKIQKVVYPERLVSDYLISLANFISQYYYTPLSLSLKTILPKNLSAFIRVLNRIEPNFRVTNPKIDINNNDHFKKIIFSEKEFLEILNTKGQILIMVPTNFHEMYFLDLLNSSIPDKLMHFKRNNKTLASLWVNLNKEENAIVLGNRSSIFLPFTNLTNIIIINPDNISYKSFSQKPYYHSLDLAKKIAFYYHAQLTFYYHY